MDPCKDVCIETLEVASGDVCGARIVRGHGGRRLTVHVQDLLNQFGLFYHMLMCLINEDTSSKGIMHGNREVA